MASEEYKTSCKISNRLAKLIRQGRATEAQIAEYEERDAQERAMIRSLPTISIVLISPFAGLTGLQGMHPLAVYLGWMTVLTLIFLFHYAHLFEDGNIEKETR